MESAITPIAWIVIGYAAFVAIAAGVGAALRAPRPRWLDQLAWMLEVLAAVLAIAVLGELATGAEPESMPTLIGYVGASVCLMPIAMGSVRDDRGPWSSGVITVAALAIGVVVARIMMVR